jgi:hypothetical protein
MSNHLGNQPLFRTEDGKILDIPPDGMLGLLALGAVGVKAWREKRRAVGESYHWEIKPPKEKASEIEDFHTQDVEND